MKYDIIGPGDLCSVLFDLYNQYANPCKVTTGPGGFQHFCKTTCLDEERAREFVAELRSAADRYEGYLDAAK